MQIEISESPVTFATSLRAYAEYRAFVRLTPMADAVRVVRIHIRRHDETLCLILADLGVAGSTQSWATAPEPTQAIDIAVQRVEERIQRRLTTNVRRL